MFLINQRSSVWSSLQSFLTSSRNWNQFCSWITPQFLINFLFSFFFASFFYFPPFVYACYLFFFFLLFSKYGFFGVSKEGEDYDPSDDDKLESLLKEAESALEPLNRKIVYKFANHVAKKMTNNLFIINNYKSNNENCYKSKDSLIKWLCTPYVFIVWDKNDLAEFVSKQS